MCKKLTYLCLIMLCMCLASCGNQFEDSDLTSDEDCVEIIDNKTDLDNGIEASEDNNEIVSGVTVTSVEDICGTYEYDFDGVKGKLIIEESEYGYSLSDFESEESYRFLAFDSYIEKIEDNRFYLKYPETVYSDDSVKWSYYVLEYRGNSIVVSLGKDSFEDVEILYEAVGK